MKLNTVISTNELLTTLNIDRRVLDSYRLKKVIRQGIDYIKANGTTYVYSYSCIAKIKKYRLTYKGSRKKGVKSILYFPQLQNRQKRRYKDLKTAQN